MGHLAHWADCAVFLDGNGVLDCAPPVCSHCVFVLCCHLGLLSLRDDNLMDFCSAHDVEANYTAYAPAVEAPLRCRTDLGGDLCLCYDFCETSCFGGRQVAHCRYFSLKNLLILTVFYPCWQVCGKGRVWNEVTKGNAHRIYALTIICCCCCLLACLQVSCYMGVHSWHWQCALAICISQLCFTACLNLNSLRMADHSCK